MCFVLCTILQVLSANLVYIQSVRDGYKIISWGINESIWWSRSMIMRGGFGNDTVMATVRIVLYNVGYFLPHYVTKCVWAFDVELFKLWLWTVGYNGNTTHVISTSMGQ